MSSAATASHLCPRHAVGTVLCLVNHIGLGGVVKAWPATAGMKLRFRLEQFLTATHALVCSGRFGVFILASERRLSSLLARYVILIRRKLFLPLRFGLLDLLRHNVLACLMSSHQY